MFRYLDTADDSFLQKDKDYNRLLKKLNNFTEYLPSEDKELLLKIINEVYYKYQKSILTKSESDTELMLSTLMALLVKQDFDIERLRK
ncbi:MAG: hypothetical protein M3Q77_08940 [Thermoproteota archaeon]|nr:hypothetical protein [Thermoproteota archaeon]